jgi:hypothetical protein
MSNMNFSASMGVYSLDTGFPVSGASAADREPKPARLLFPAGFMGLPKWFRESRTVP